MPIDPIWIPHSILSKPCQRPERGSSPAFSGFVAHLLSRNGVAVITAAISPYREIRDQNRVLIGDFVEVYAKCSIEELTRRDVKGLYEKALRGEIQNFTGVSDPYEEPLNPQVVVDTEKETMEESLAKILAYLEQEGHVQTAGARV